MVYVLHCATVERSPSAPCTLSPTSQSTAARFVLSVRFVRAARHGHAKAQAMVGACYWDGIGVPQDVSKAVHW